MLTGDKGLTAAEIGVSCGLMPSAEELAEDITETLPTLGPGQEPASKRGSKVFTLPEDIVDALELFEIVKKMNIEKTKYKSHFVVVSGVTIAIILDKAAGFMHDEMSNLLLDCESTIVYRSSPA